MKSNNCEKVNKKIDMGFTPEWLLSKLLEIKKIYNESDFNVIVETLAKIIKQEITGDEAKKLVESIVRRN